ncbi:hypothetical protein VTN77DRAFT_1853 [Rasamsonia byssochlamydoides]|uniref:uncharacterized protein n=1 Tax=Rasamsonia byssochlamydoides TaxID=89139 RepID=UPI003744B0E7
MPAKPPPSSASLYGIQRPKNTVSQKDLTSSSTLAFTTHLSSLISKEASSAAGGTEGSSTIRGRARPSKASSKDDIFSIHNKGARKRAAADEEGDSPALQQVHQRTEDIGGHVDAATLHRSKRRMEEKARLYEDLQKGYHLAEDSSDEGDDYAARMRRKERNALVDFDRKWAEEEAAKRERGEDSDEAEDDEDADETGSLVEYEDEFGRTRKGTRAEAARAAQLRGQQQRQQGEEVHDRSRPARPANLIYGETIQTEAFNPDAAVAAKMSYLASHRDRSPTPPEETHYDADAEVRTRGTAFYVFSRDEKQREKEMEELLNARKETEREREARSERKAERERLKEERRKKIQELRGKRQAERFLEGLGQDLAKT